MITISPMMIRIAELRMRSAPMIGPTVVTDRTVAGPNLATSAFSRSSNGVPGTTVGAELGAETAGDADGRGVGVGVAVGFAGADGEAGPEPARRSVRRSKPATDPPARSVGAGGCRQAETA